TVNPPPATPTITGTLSFCTGGNTTLTSSSATGNQWYNGGTAIAGATNQTLVVTAAGTYTVIVTDPVSGCASAASAAATVTVTPPPATPTITGTLSFCTGGNTTLTSSSATGNQWYNGGTAIAGATNQTLVVTAAGTYTVIVTDPVSGCASAASAVATVTVTPPPATPTITGTLSFCTGGNTTLTSSSATGNQWYNGGTAIAGATNQTLVVTAAGTYTVIVTDPVSGCVSAASAGATVTVTPPPATPTITGTLSFCTGGNTTLTSSSATGNQWYNGGTAIAGATNQTLVVTAAGTYTVIVTDPVSGCVSAASAATVTVNPPPATPTITGTLSFCTGGNTTLTSSSATGNQWYNGGTAIAGATNQTLVVTAAGTYTVIATSAAGCPSAASAAATVTVNPPPATPTITGTLSFCTGGNTTLTSSSATGNQWYNGGTAIAGATNQTLVVTAAGTYTVIVTDPVSGCASAASAAATVTVNPPPATPTITGTLSFCTGGNTTLTSSSATGNQWYNGGTAIAGATNQTLIVTAAGTYTVIVKDPVSGCVSAASAVATVTVTPPPATPTITGTLSFCTGGNTTLTSSSATGNQWYNGGTAIAGATNQTLVVTAAGTYTVIVTDPVSGCASAASAVATVTVTPPPATPTITGTLSFCTGGNTTLTSSSATGNQWYNGGTAIAGATNQTLVVTAAGTYTVIVTDPVSGCASAASAVATVTVTPPPATPTITGTLSFCTGGNTTLTSSSATGNQWYNGGTAIAGATNQTLVVTAAGKYTVIVTDPVSGCASAASAGATVTVTPPPATPTITGTLSFCTGGNTTLTSSSATGNQWYNGGTAIAGATNQTLVVTAAGTYTVIVTDPVSGCVSAASAGATVTVNATLTSTTNTTICANLVPYIWNGQSLTVTGTYTANLTGAGGCDSVATLNLTVSPTLASTTNTTICANLVPYIWNGQSLTVTGTYTANLTGAGGCDSVATLNLTVSPTLASTTNTTICANLVPYIWNGQSLTVTGTYTANLTSAGGCDSVATLNLTVSPALTSTTNTT